MELQYTVEGLNIDFGFKRVIVKRIDGDMNDC